MSSPAPDIPLSLSDAKANHHVGISIVGFRNTDEILTCLESLEASSDPDFFVLICENGGRESFDALIAALGERLRPEPTVPNNAPSRVSAMWRGRLSTGQIVEVLCAEDNVGFAGGVNITLDRLHAFAEWTAVWLLNPDTLPESYALAALAEKARSDPQYGIVGSRLVLVALNRVQAYGGRWRTLVGRGFNIGFHALPDATPDATAVERDMTYVLGASMYVTRAFIEAVGPMDESYFLYAEEVDWCLRRGSFKLGYADSSVVHHVHGQVPGEDVSRNRRSHLSVYLDERNKHLLSRKFFPHLYPLIAATTLALTTLHLRTAAWRNFRSALAGWWAGLRGEVGKPRWMH